MKSYALFKEYIWLVNTINFAGKITLEDINRKWVETDMSEGLPIVRSTFNRHKDAIQDIFGIDIECDKRDGFKYYIGNYEVLKEESIQTGCSPLCRSIPCWPKAKRWQTGFFLSQFHQTEKIFTDSSRR